MTRVFNFSPGPATLPLAVLQQVQAELLDWQGTGMSVMEMSHRDKPFLSIASEAEACLRRLLAVPANYRVLFLQGGAYGQFAAVPMNLLRGKPSADFLVTGAWSEKAVREFAKFGRARIAAQSTGGFTSVPPPSSWSLDKDAAYVYYVPNETIEGVEFQFTPEVGSVPLVADFSSAFLSRPIDVSQFGLVYAGAQKNAGPAGLTFVIVRDDLLGSALAVTPSIWDYRQVADAESMLNTPPCFAWYVSGLVFKWIESEGGLAAMEARNARKAALLYDYIDAEPFFSNPVAVDARSRMNVVFRLADPGLDALFLKQAADARLPGLKGHRAVGGMRASLYNAMSEEGVAALVEFMREFVRSRA